MTDDLSIVTKTVRLPSRLVHEIEERADFNRFLVEAAERALALIKTAEIVEAHQAEHGVFTPEQIAHARRAWHSEAVAAAGRGGRED
ncbi:hypothetical protein [Kitasatospora sp. MAP5-34]|uniref:hypothetical protein n=1 Tax=Kitasatospora sp. MAP5-34 TaxID=3035102 RepID=UPI002476C45E|nr:hypothetical protein [Kitasatospora sp. MAP5-34]MDH6579904.1 hypothetical protein [Kitasatospora sp. MAP5-34]